PNPFNPSTVISYSIPSVGASRDVSVLIRVFDVLGREVATLVNKEQPAGNYKVTFNATHLSSGIYFYRISATGEAGSFIQTKKMILLK
ncbi:MAG TPA: T9SS type A sorting domain-containing protein, partial [Ignavibacteria bacterium]|nr:T9SS type A sorting domain-containing protein [Ignavibacteria bacterium]